MKWFLFAFFFSSILILIILTSSSPGLVYAGSETIAFSGGGTTASGYVGDTNTINLTGGANNTTYTFYWDSTSTGTTVNLGTCATARKGTTCSLGMTVPASSKGNWIIHSYSTANGNGSNTLTYTVNPKITGSTPSTGTYGTSVSVTGTGFAGETVTVTLSTYTLGTGTPTSGAGGTNGNLNVTAGAPAMPYGSKAVAASGTSSGSVSSAYTFTMNSSVSINPSSGRSGTSTNVSGYGFDASSQITIWQDGSATSTTGSSDVNGNFSNISYTPTGAAGARSINAKDAASHTAATSATFTMSPFISLSNNNGAPGATTNISGSGFAASSTVTIWQDGSATSTTGNTNTSGTISPAIVYTPTGSSGSHPISARDASANTSNDVSYTITAAGTLSLSTPSSANLGSVTLAAPYGTATGNLGTIQVTDNRGSYVGWTLTATTTHWGQVNTAVRVSGTAGGLTSSGTYNYATGGIYTITITKQGIVGNSEYSITGLEATPSNAKTGTNVAIGTRGVTATFASGNYNVGDSWTITVRSIPIDNNGYFTVNPNNNTFTVVSGDSVQVGPGSSHTFTAAGTDSATIMSASSGHGEGVYTINPDLTFNIPMGTYTGAYSATITETVN